MDGGDAGVVSIGKVARRLAISSELARRMVDKGRFGPVLRDTFGYRLVSSAAVETVARERERQKTVRR